MAYYQNVFNSEFLGVYAIADRQWNKTYRVKPNINTSMLMTNWVPGPYDTSTCNLFGITYSLDSGHSYNTIRITLTTSTTTSAEQIVSDLNANVAFASMFTAATNTNIPTAYSTPNPAAHFAGSYVTIQANSKFRETFRAYIPNLADPTSPTTSAEIVLKFNLKAPVVQMPGYFQKYVIGQQDGSSLVMLSQPNENFVITNAKLSTTPLADWQLLAGTCGGLFTFQKMTVDGSDRITEIIEYPAGAVAGDLGRRIAYVYSGANNHPTQITEEPRTLISGDLVTPP